MPLKTADEFVNNARGMWTAAQRAEEVHVQDCDRGMDSLVHLDEVAESCTAQAGIIAGFLAGLYNAFDLTELRSLDEDLFEHCLAVVRLG